MIGIARRILDCMLLEQKRSHLSHEVLTTLMAEVTAIMNARPLIPVSSDPESLLILTPAMLLTLKIGSAPPPPSGSFQEVHLIREQWKQVQSLADRRGVSCHLKENNNNKKVLCYGLTIQCNMFIFVTVVTRYCARHESGS